MFHADTKNNGMIRFRFMLLALLLLLCPGLAPRAWATSASVTATETNGPITVSGTGNFTTYHNCDNATPPNCVDVSTGSVGVYRDSKSSGGYLGGSTGSGSASWSGQVNGALMSQGQHTFYAVAGDSKGQTAEASTNLTIDNTPQGLSINVPDQPKAPFDISGSVSFKNNIDGPEGSVSLAMDSVYNGIASKSYEGTSPNISYSDMKGSGALLDAGTMSNGQHTVRATASAANGAYATTSTPFTINNTPAGLSVSVPDKPQAPFDVTGSVQFVECATTTEGTVYLFRDGGYTPVASKAYEGTSINFSYSEMKGGGALLDAGTMSNGQHSIRALVYATNNSYSDKSFPFTIDNTPKGLSVSVPDQPRAPFDVTGAVQLVECANTTEGTVYLFMDGGYSSIASKAFEGTSISFSYSDMKGGGKQLDAGAMSNGPHTIRALVYATNNSYSDKTVSFTIDNKPIVTVPSPGEVGGIFDPVASAQLVEVLAGNEGTLFMALDNAAFSTSRSKPCTGTSCSASWSELAGQPLDAQAMAKGKHKIRAQVYAYNNSVTTVETEFTVVDYDPRDKTGSGNLDNAAPVKQ
jgi:hypothetical protein